MHNRKERDIMNNKELLNMQTVKALAKDLIVEWAACKCADTCRGCEYNEFCVKIAELAKVVRK